MSDPNLQYGRSCSLIVATNSTDLNNAMDLSQFRIKFSIKRSDTSTPNTADIRVYNLSKDTAELIQKEYKRVVLEAGYEGNRGVIFQGNVKQVILGRESAQDTFIDIIAGDGDQAYNFALVNKTIGKGSTLLDRTNAAIAPMVGFGVTAGFLGDMGATQLPRGKVMFGNSRNYLTQVSQTEESSWSIQNERVEFVKIKSYLPGEAVVLTSETGMIGTPQQTNEGVNVKCLLNPKIRTSTRVQIAENLIQRQKLNLEQISAAKGDVNAINNLLPRNLSADGTYYVLVVEHSGDTRGIEWYSSLICLTTDVSANPTNSVQPGFGP